MKRFNLIGIVMVTATIVGCSEEDIFPAGRNLRGSCYIEDDDRVLVLTLRNGKVDLPGGHVDGSESSDQVAARETSEETNIDIKAPSSVLDVAGSTDIWACESVEANLDWDDVSDEIDDIELMDLAEVRAADWSIPEVKEVVIDFLD